MCEFWWKDLTTCDVSASLEAIICQMHATKMIRPLGDGLETQLRCGGWIRKLYTEMKLCAFWGDGPGTRMSGGRKV